MQKNHFLLLKNEKIPKVASSAHLVVDELPHVRGGLGEEDEEEGVGRVHQHVGHLLLARSACNQ